jgi:8-oxo-dGTP diphosphatase
MQSAGIRLVVAGVLVNDRGEVLLTERPAGKPWAGYWEFPGGKIEDGETPEAALVRELAEELGIQIAAAALVPLTFVSYAYPEFHLLMPLYLCRRWRGTVTAAEEQRLIWVRPDAMATFPLLPADEPVAALLQKNPSNWPSAVFSHQED